MCAIEANVLSEGLVEGRERESLDLDETPPVLVDGVASHGATRLLHERGARVAKGIQIEMKLELADWFSSRVVPGQHLVGFQAPRGGIENDVNPVVGGAGAERFREKNGWALFV
jgi:hypothetical protein